MTAQVSVSVTDPEGRVVRRSVLPLRADGALTITVELPRSAGRRPLLDLDPPDQLVLPSVDLERLMNGALVGASRALMVVDDAAALAGRAVSALRRGRGE